MARGRRDAVLIVLDRRRRLDAFTATATIVAFGDSIAPAPRERAVSRHSFLLPQLALLIDNSEFSFPNVK